MYIYQMPWIFVIIVACKWNNHAHNTYIMCSIYSNFLRLNLFLYLLLNFTFITKISFITFDHLHGLTILTFMKENHTPIVSWPHSDSVIIVKNFDSTKVPVKTFWIKYLTLTLTLNITWLETTLSQLHTLTLQERWLEVKNLPYLMCHAQSIQFFAIISLRLFCLKYIKFLSFKYSKWRRPF